jgi:alanine transaminase
MNYILYSVPPSLTHSLSHALYCPAVRQEVAEFLEERDGYPARSTDIYLTNGASDGVKMFLQLIIRENELGHNDGILCPVPQYPLYSGAVALNHGHLLPYYLSEESDWGLTIDNLDAAYAKSKEEGKTARALVLINPGNPTGAVRLPLPACPPACL